ncbi:FAD-binding oxidoreductase [Compostibacter hankyongensis]
MEEHLVRILSVAPVTHNVRCFKVEKPEGYRFIPGQATEVSIPKSGWREERRPFTFTSLNEWDHLEFTIKIYDDHGGVTQQLGKLESGDELLLHDVWGAIQYKGEGTFIAGGAGVTPFIAIFRQLQRDEKLGNNRLLFSNRTASDIILRDEFERMLGPAFVNTLTSEKADGMDNRRIDETYLRENIASFDQPFYVCGPDQMVEDVKQALHRLGAGADMVTVEL